MTKRTNNPAAPVEERPGPAEGSTRRFTLNLTQEAYDQMSDLADRTNHSMTELIRFGLAIIHHTYDDVKKGNKLVIAAPDGRVLRELVLPI